jgi:HEAT repeat protein
VRLELAHVLRRTPGPEAERVTALVRLLGDDDPNVRWAAALGLGALPTASGVERLTEALSDPDLAVRCAAAKALGACGEVAAPASAALWARTRDSTWFEARTCARELGRLGEAALPSLRQGLSEGAVDRQRHLAVIALRELGAPPLPELTLALELGVSEEVCEALVALGEPAIPALSAALSSAGPLRKASARALARLAAQHQAAREVLTEALASPVARLREAAAAGLPALPDWPERLATLAAEDPSPAVRGGALASLVRQVTESGQVVPALVRGLTDADEGVREASVWGFTRWGALAGSARERLGALLHGDDVAVALAALEALTQISTAEQSRASLEQALSRDSQAVPLAAASALLVGGVESPAAVAALAAALEDASLEYGPAGGYLKAAAHSQLGLDLVERHLQGRHEDEAWRALRWGPHALQSLQRLLHHEQPSIRSSAAACLREDHGAEGGVLLSRAAEEVPEAARELAQYPPPNVDRLTAELDAGGDRALQAAQVLLAEGSQLEGKTLSQALRRAFEDCEPEAAWLFACVALPRGIDVDRAAQALATTRFFPYVDMGGGEGAAVQALAEAGPAGRAATRALWVWAQRESRFNSPERWGQALEASLALLQVGGWPDDVAAVMAEALAAEGRTFADDFGAWPVHPQVAHQAREGWLLRCVPVLAQPGAGPEGARALEALTGHRNPRVRAAAAAALR